jgi:uncharacterized membrane protein YgcG
MKTPLKVITLLGIGILCASAYGADPARPGSVNYIEGAAFLEGRQLQAHDIGSTELIPGAVLSTQAGKAEILLTPGVFLRLDDYSAVKMISPDLTLTKVELLHGRAGVEVDEVYPQNDLQIIDASVTTQLVKTGYYEFDANHPMAMVFKGLAAIEVGDGQYKVVKGHHEVKLPEGETLKPVKFDARTAEDELYNWSSLRSQYLAEANNQIAGAYAGAASFNPGWYWDTYGLGYTFIGAGPFWSPFGFGFYPPWYGGFYGGGYYGRGVYGRGAGGGFGDGRGRVGFSGGGVARGGGGHR